MLLDGDTLDLVQHIDTVLADMSGHELEQRINPELMQSVLEIATPVRRDAAEVESQLRTLRLRRLDRVPARYEGRLRRDASVLAVRASTDHRRATATEILVDQMQYIARRELIFGLHIHVAVDDPEKSDPGVNGSCPSSRRCWRSPPVPVLARRGDRPRLLAADGVRGTLRSGPPPRFRNYQDYAEVIGQLEKTGCIADYTHIWWDIRLHPRYGTVEIRICDGVTRVEDAVALTAYCQFVKLLSEQHDAGEEIPSYHRISRPRTSGWAARYGLEAPIMDLTTGRRNRIPVAQMVRRTLRAIELHARELGYEREPGKHPWDPRRGNGADRQLRVFNANRDIVEVASEIAAATVAGATGPEPAAAAERRLARQHPTVAANAIRRPSARSTWTRRSHSPKPRPTMRPSTSGRAGRGRAERSSASRLRPAVKYSVRASREIVAVAPRREAPRESAPAGSAPSPV